MERKWSTNGTISNFYYLSTYTALPPTRFIRMECFTVNWMLISRSEIQTRSSQVRNEWIWLFKWIFTEQISQSTGSKCNRYASESLSEQISTTTPISNNNGSNDIHIQINDYTLWSHSNKCLWMYENFGLINQSRALEWITCKRNDGH